MMNRKIELGAALALLITGFLIAHYSWGSTQEDSRHITQTFWVDNMTCAACPITVRKAMSRVDGVIRVEVNFEAKTVTAIFDPALTDTESIAAASSAVGFPARVSGEAP